MVNNKKLSQNLVKNIKMQLLTINTGFKKRTSTNKADPFKNKLKDQKLKFYTNPK